MSSHGSVVWTTLIIRIPPDRATCIGHVHIYCVKNNAKSCNEYGLISRSLYLGTIEVAYATNQCFRKDSKNLLDMIKTIYKHII